MKIYLGSDHAGFELKEFLKEQLSSAGHEIVDMGTDSTESVDYPDYAFAVAEQVAGSDGLGILVCGTGIGMSIAANKVRGVRAACCSNIYEAVMARRHNNANVLCLGSRVLGAEHALAIAVEFLSNEFEGGRHDRRINKISNYEKGDA